MDVRFQKAFDDIKRVVEERYGIPVIVGHIRQGFSGDLNGAEIFINEDITSKHKLFNLLHLFGHTIQWAVREDGYALGYQLFYKPNKKLLARLIAYEKEAARYSAALLFRTNNRKFLPWLSKYSDSDIRFLKHFYITGEVKSLSEFRRRGVKNIRPLRIPRFAPRRKTRRANGIVVLAKDSRR